MTPDMFGKFCRLAETSCWRGCEEQKAKHMDSVGVQYLIHLERYSENFDIYSIFDPKVQLKLEKWLDINLLKTLKLADVHLVWYNSSTTIGNEDMETANSPANSPNNSPNLNA